MDVAGAAEEAVSSFQGQLGIADLQSLGIAKREVQLCKIVKRC